MTLSSASSTTVEFWALKVSAVIFCVVAMVDVTKTLIAIIPIRNPNAPKLKIPATTRINKPACLRFGLGLRLLFFFLFLFIVPF